MNQAFSRLKGLKQTQTHSLKLNMPVKKPNNQIVITTNKKEINTEAKDNNIYLAGFCVICWKKAVFFCADCRITGYCCMSHMAKHWKNHRELCTVVSRLRKEGLYFIL